MLFKAIQLSFLLIPKILILLLFLPPVLTENRNGNINANKYRKATKNPVTEHR